MVDGEEWRPWDSKCILVIRYLLSKAAMNVNTDRIELYGDHLGCLFNLDLFKADFSPLYAK